MGSRKDTTNLFKTVYLTILMLFFYFSTLLFWCYFFIILNIYIHNYSLRKKKILTLNLYVHMIRIFLGFFFTDGVRLNSFSKKKSSQLYSSADDHILTLRLKAD